MGVSPETVDRNVCVICGVRKEREEFPKAPGCSDGRRRTCKKCSYETVAKAVKRRDPSEFSEARRRARLKYAFKMSLEEYNALFEQQGGVCRICQQPERAFSKRSGKTMWLTVDHCHHTMRVRGLLCKMCNTALGQLGDDRGRLLQMIAYLDEDGGQ